MLLTISNLKEELNNGVLLKTTCEHAFEAIGKWWMWYAPYEITEIKISDNNFVFSVRCRHWLCRKTFQINIIGVKSGIPLERYSDWKEFSRQNNEIILRLGRRKNLFSKFEVILLRRYFREEFPSVDVKPIGVINLESGAYQALVYREKQMDMDKIFFAIKKSQAKVASVFKGSGKIGDINSALEEALPTYNCRMSI